MKRQTHKLIIHEFNKRKCTYVEKRIRADRFGSCELVRSIHGTVTILEACYTYPHSRETHLYIERRREVK